LASELNKPRVEVKLFSLPGRINRVRRNAVPEKALPRVESLKSEWPRFGCIDHFEDVNTHPCAELLQFVNLSDIDAAINVLEQLVISPDSQKYTALVMHL
jgi:hypothetical protein